MKRMVPVTLAIIALAGMALAQRYAFSGPGKPYDAKTPREDSSASVRPGARLHGTRDRLQPVDLCNVRDWCRTISWENAKPLQNLKSLSVKRGAYRFNSECAVNA